MTLLAITLWGLGAVLAFDLNDQDHKKNGEESQIGEAVMCFMWPFMVLWIIIQRLGNK